MKTSRITAIALAASAGALSSAPVFADSPTPVVDDGPVVAQAPAGPKPVAGENVPLDDAPGPQGYNDIFGPNTTYAGAFTLRMEDGEIVRAFCVEFGALYENNDAEMTLTAEPVTRLRAAGDADLLPQALWIAANSTEYDESGSPKGDTVGTPIAVSDGYPVTALQAVENAATQLAIWNVVNGEDISGALDPRAVVRANELIDLVDGDDNTLGTADDQRIELSPVAYEMSASWIPASSMDGRIEIAALVVDADGSVGPAGAVDVQLSTADGDIDLDPTAPGVQSSVVLTTDTDGNATTEMIETAALEADVELELVVDAESGTMLTPTAAVDGTPRQQVITATGSQFLRAATVQLPAAPPTTEPPTTEPPTTEPPTTEPPTTEPPTTEPPTTEPPEDAEEELPRTGPDRGPVFIIFAALLGSAGLVLATRRTRPGQA